jgi:hypothetical protein
MAFPTPYPPAKRFAQAGKPVPPDNFSSQKGVPAVCVEATVPGVLTASQDRLKSLKNANLPKRPAAPATLAKSG